MHARPHLLLIPVAALTMLAACGADDDPVVTGSGATDATTATTAASGEPLALDHTVVRYHYRDSSVPPEHHRSYTVTVTPDEAHIGVDSYGDVLHDETRRSTKRRGPSSSAGRRRCSTWAATTTATPAAPVGRADRSWPRTRTATRST